MSMTSRAVVLLVAILLSLAGSAAAQPDRPGAPKSKSAPQAPPMIFYLAKGEDDACGQGCSEWIAAEGRFEADTAQRLRAFLTRLGKRKLPILFHSNGGNGTTAMTMGRLLREREMTASVYETIPVGCVGASEQSCRALKQSGQVLPSTLRNVANCSSACVFALIGAKVRQVPPGARLGVHSGKVIVPWAEARRIGYSDKQISSFQRTRQEENNAQARRYVQEMKVDVRLFDLLSKVPHEQVYYLTPNEIAAFGIDTREAREAHWIATELLPRQLWTMKYFVEAKGPDRKELHTSLIRLECGDVAHAKLSYFRSLGQGETGAGQRTIKLAAGSQSALLTSYGSPFKMEAIETGTSYHLWYAYARFDLFETAAARQLVELVESEQAGTPPRITKLSTAGLSQAITALRQRCNGGA
jgi:hypothetical protein